jgi:hypothetical protein
LKIVNFEEFHGFTEGNRRNCIKAVLQKETKGTKKEVLAEQGLGQALLPSLPSVRIFSQALSGWMSDSRGRKLKELDKRGFTEGNKGSEEGGVGRASARAGFVTFVSFCENPFSNPILLPFVT